MKKIALLLILVIVLSTMLTSCSMLPDYTVRKIYIFLTTGEIIPKSLIIALVKMDIE